MFTAGWGRDNPIAAMVNAKLWRMNLEQQIPGERGPDLPVDYLNGPEGYPHAVEHGELGLLQSFTEGPPLVGGGNPRSFTDAVSREPNSVGLSNVALQLLASQEIQASRI